MTLTCRLLRVVGAAALGAALLHGQPFAQTRDRSTPTPVPAGTLTLGGTVTLNEGTPPPLVRRARVTLTFDGAFPTQITDTDTDGKFRVDNLPAGTYRILVEKPGFVPVDRGPGHATVRPVVVTLGPGPSPSLSIVMQHAAAMEGQILNDKAEPAANIVVAAMRLVYGAYGRRPEVVRQATTDDLGRFRVHTLPAGDYYLQAAPDPVTAATAAPSGDRQGFALGFYPGTPRVDDARVVTLTPGQELSNLDFRLTPVRLANVAGRVLDASGRSPSAFGFRIQRVGAPPGEVRGFAAQIGSFQFPSVPPGEYWLLASAQLAAGADVEYAAMRVNVSGQDLTGLVMTTTKGAVVNGRVEAEGGAAVPADLQVIAHETEFELPPLQPPPPPVSPAPGTVGADGTFTFTSLFGNRVFRVGRLPDGWALENVFLDDVDVTDTPVEPGGSPGPRALRVVITNHTATVSGTVEAAAGGPAAGRVVVFGEDQRRWGLRSRTIRTVEARADGTYAIAGLLPGKYFIIAVDDLDEGAWNDPEVLTRLQATAESLVVTDGQTVTMALKVQ